MYISKIKITNFRNFLEEEIEFAPGLNVIIGHNNAGKTNLIRALQFVFDRELRLKLSIDDFNKEYKEFSDPPKIEIRVTISEHKDKEDDKNVIYDWLIKETPSYEAQLTYIFSLPSKHWKNYKSEVDKLKKDDGTYKQQECFNLIEKRYLHKYISRIYGGDPNREEKADLENLDRFDFQFLDAIRDAEKQMFFGYDTILRDVLNYFLDYDLREGKDFEELSPEKKDQLREKEIWFNENSKTLLERLIGRVSKEKILKYAKETGADKGGKPDFDAEISEQELLFALRLIVEKNGFKLPIKNNGLGYNNLLFIALVLAKMQMECSSFMGDNAKVFPILAVEEPEAHLHPSMQYKFLQFLRKNLSSQEQARQVFITSHSTHITSAVDLNSIICLYEDSNATQRVGYPGKVFSDEKEDKKSKTYVERFLDATKSNMLFADRIVFVEGLSEQILLPCFAAEINKEEEIVDKHVTIISVDSRVFKHFLKIFAYNAGTKPYAINKKVVCITDADPTKKELEPEDNNNKRWKKCYPFELNQNDGWEYKPISSHAQDLKTFSDSLENIDVKTPPVGTGKTLEYELVINNPSCKLLITEGFPSKGKNRTDYFTEIMQAYDEDKSFDELKALSSHENIIESIDSSNWNTADKKKALIAATYYQAVESRKGEHAFYLEKQLRENLAKSEGRDSISIPQYIIDAINFITG